MLIIRIDYAASLGIANLGILFCPVELGAFVNPKDGFVNRQL